MQRVCTPSGHAGVCVLQGERGAVGEQPGGRVGERARSGWEPHSGRSGVTERLPRHDPDPDSGGAHLVPHPERNPCSFYLEGESGDEARGRGWGGAT
eukprot:359748-Chlamydomonas_euryale.AAC.3